VDRDEDLLCDILDIGLAHAQPAQESEHVRCVRVKSVEEGRR
jgi:hypothetical protein